jgi:hypothetical protein
MSTPHLTWAKGGDAWFLEASGDAVVLLSTVPSPPGSRIEGKLEDGTVVKVKIHGSKKQDDGRFRLEGRPLDLLKPVRERIVALATEAR